MSVNMGLIDRIARVVTGMIVYASPLGGAPTGWNWIGWVGIAPLATVIVGVCSLYRLLGVSTCAAKRTN